MICRRKATALALAMSLTSSGCDVFDAGERYLEGEVIPGTARLVEINTISGYYPGEAEPSVSPDGRLIAFHQRMDDGLSLRVLDITTGEVRGLTTGFAPDWSPDGAWIAFYDGAAVHKIRADGSERTGLATEGRNFHPDWSPDGTQIAYDRSLADETGPGGTWVMNADGSERRPVCGAGAPDWLPDSQALIGLQAGTNDQPFEFVLCDVVSGVETPLSGQAIFDLSDPHVSPDGLRVVYQAADGIWVAADDGSWARRILPNDLYRPDGGERLVAAASPSWHPDGRRIIYEHFAITAYDDGGVGYGPVVQGEATFRLLDVDAALDASNL